MRVTADYYYPDWECLVDFFLQSGVESLLAYGMGEDKTSNLRSIVLSQKPMTSQPQRPLLGQGL